MVEKSTDSGNTSILSQSYDRGIKRISGKLDETQDEFALADKIVEARKAGWEELFEKFAKATDTTELNYLTLRPCEDSDESEVPVRYPVRKSSAQIQYWIDTEKAPCLLLHELKGSDEESISISESEAEEPEEFKSSTSRSMVAISKPMDTSHERRVESGSSFSSVDTAAYIKSSANSTRGEKRRRNTDPGRLDNNKVARCINAAWPKVLVTKLPDPDNNKEEEVSRESITKKRKLYIGDETLFDINTEDVPVESPKLRFDRMSLHPAMDSPSTFPQRKTMNFGPRLLTATWKQSRNNSITKRFTKKRSTLFRPRTPISTRSSLRRAVNDVKKSAKETETKLSLKDEKTSSSIGSEDVSQIIKEDLNRDAETQLSSVARIKRINEDVQNSGEGSIFKVRNDSCEETLENRKQSIQHAKKNLYKTLFEASIDSGSPAERNKPAQLKLILHDFLDLKDCCGKLERENNEYWIRRRKQKEIPSEEEKENCSSRKKKLRSSKRSKKSIYKTKFDFSTDSSIASEKVEFLKRKETKDDKKRENVTFMLERSSEDEDIFQVLTSISKSKHQSYDENIKNTSITRTNTFRILSSSSEDGVDEKVEKTQKIKRRSKLNDSSKITTVSKNSEDLKSQTIQKKRSNSPENSEDCLDGTAASKVAKTIQTSTISSKSLEKEKKTAEKVDKTLNSTIEDVARSKHRNITKISSGSEISEIFQSTRKKPSIASQSSAEKRKKKIIASSCFEKEKKTAEKVNTTLNSTRENVARSKHRNITKTSSGSEISEIFQLTRKKSTIASQSLVEKRKKKAEKVDKTLESTIKDVARIKHQNFTKTSSESEISEIFQPTRKKASIAARSSEKKRRPETFRELRNMSGKYLKEKKHNDLTIKSKKDGKKLNRKSKSSEILISIDGKEAELEINDDNNEKENKTAEIYSNVKKSRDINAKIIKSDDDGSKNSVKMINSGEKATRTRLSTLVCDLSDDSSVEDDTIIFSQKNYAGSNSIEDKTINSRVLKQLKKRSRKNRLTSTVVYRTKESWETDSDHF